MRAETGTAGAQADLAAAAPAGKPAFVSSVMFDRASDYFEIKVEKNRKARPCPAAAAAVSSMGTASAGVGARSAPAFCGGGAIGMGYVGGAVFMPSTPLVVWKPGPRRIISAFCVSSRGSNSAAAIFLSTKESSARGAAGRHALHPHRIHFSPRHSHSTRPSLSHAREPCAYNSMRAALLYVCCQLWCTLFAESY